MDVCIGKVGTNSSRILRHIKNLKAQGVELVVFPEAALTGYCFGSKEEALGAAIDAKHSESLKEIQQECDRLDIAAILGYAERVGDRLHNSASLFEPGRPRQTYRKTHLPFLGLDRFVDEGDEIPLWETRFGKIGVLICFDSRFPEPARKLALEGADLIAVPTNWPEGADVSADHICIARAAENNVFVVTCNRVGTENGFRFIGRSKIIHPSGRIMAAAEAFEVVLVAELNLAEAREKRRVVIPGEYETETFAARRPNLYCQESRLTVATREEAF